MFSLSIDPSYAAYSVRTVNKATDRFLIREIFRREFYGDRHPAYPDNGLWEIYDRMETRDVFGAYLIYRGHQLLFLLEVHPLIEMDVDAEAFADSHAVGLYSFFYSKDKTIYLPAFRACVDALLKHPGIDRIYYNNILYTAANSFSE